MSICKASEILRNEAYIEVRRNASGPEGLRPGGTGDEGNAALRCFDLAQGHELVEWQMGVFRQPRQKSCINVGPSIIPRPNLFIGIGGLKYQIISVPRTDDLKPCGEAILCKAGRDRGSRMA
jgi:hypothetical protein